MIPAVLVIENELPMRRVLRSALDGRGYRVWEAQSMQEGLSTFAARSPQAVLVDLELPHDEGFEIVERIRETSAVPIVVISGEDAERDPVRALAGGANDYVTKPVRAAELFARLKLALRSAARVARHAVTFVVGPLRIERLEQRVFLNEVEVELTPTEFRLLQVLGRDPGTVINYRELLRQVWGAPHLDDMQSLRVFVMQLRQKLERDPTNPQLLLTTAGVGYRLQPP